MPHYRLDPTKDERKNRWVLNIPGEISESGKRERKFFRQHCDALAAANRLRSRTRAWGAGLKFLTPQRMAEAAACYELLDQAKLPETTLHSIVSAHLKAQQRSRKSITLAKLFDEYSEARQHRSPAYLAALKYCKEHLKLLQEEKVSDLDSGRIKLVLGWERDAQYNADLRYLRAVLNWGQKRGYLVENPVLKLELRHRPRTEVQVLPVETFERMLADALTQRLELIPLLVLGGFYGIRTDEIKRLRWANVDLEASQVTIPAAAAKTRRKRFPPIPPNGLAWLELYREKTNRTLAPEVLVLAAFTPQTLRSARRANWQAVHPEAEAGQAPPPWPQNALRHSAATYWVNYHGDLDTLALILGHTSTEISFKHYVGGVTRSDAAKYWQLGPPGWTPPPLSLPNGANGNSSGLTEREGGPPVTPC